MKSRLRSVAGACWRSSHIFLTDIASPYLSAFVAEIAWRKENHGGFEARDLPPTRPR